MAETNKDTSSTLSGKNIILGVSGGIAAYKSADLASKLTQKGVGVTAILTRNACKFVTPLLFESLTGNPSPKKMFQPMSEGGSPYPHLRPKQDVDLLILAPATANLIGKMAGGLADDLLSTLCLSLRCPVLICPAMNTEMWTHPAVQNNVEIIKGFGHTILGPASGRQACGTMGEGRMVEPEYIVADAESILAAGK